MKRPDMYGFRNPGLMRVPIEQAIRGGDSDCRNRLVQKMFQFVGAGDQAGSGVPRIFGVWKDQSWRSPVVHEKRDPEQTLFELRMASLLPAEVVVGLEQEHGSMFEQLTALEKLIVVTAAVEGYVDHKRVREITDEHPADITKTLSKLSREGLLGQSGHGRGTIYFSRDPASLALEVDRLAGASEPIGDGIWRLPSTVPPDAEGSKPLDPRSGGLAGSSRGLRDRLGDLPPEAEVVAEARELLAQRFPDGVPRKMKPEAVRQLILELCATQVLSVKELAAVLDRAPDFIRAQHIRPLVTLGLLAPQFADRPNHPNQRYQRRSDGDIPKPSGT